MKGQVYAVSSGFIASWASICGKYAVSSHETEDLCHILSTFFPSHVKETCLTYIIVLRIFFIVGMILLNTVMWTTFTKALRYASTSLEATILNTASNFFSTAVISQLIFQEVVTLLWWMGTAMIICGLLVIHHSKNVTPRKPGSRKKAR